MNKPRLIEILAGLLIAISLALSTWALTEVVNIKSSNADRDRQLVTITQQLTALIINGSNNFQTHERFDNERVENLKARVTIDETAIREAAERIREAAELKTEVKVLGTKLDNIAKQLEEIKAASIVIKTQTKP